MLSHELFDFISEFSSRISKIEENALSVGLDAHISAAEIRILDKIGLEGSEKMSDIARSLSVTMSTLTVACDKLEGKDLIVRKRDIHDKRTVCVSLTPKGLVAFEYHKAFHENLIEMMFSGFSDNEKHVLASGVKNMNEYLEGHSKN